MIGIGFKGFLPHQLDIVGANIFFHAVTVSSMAKHLPAFPSVAELTRNKRPLVTEGRAYYYESRMLGKEAKMILLEAEKRRGKILYN